MVYAGKKDDKRFTLGVSGRLMDNNLVMWDEETGTLWSQILGVALHGKSKGVELDLIPAVFVGFDTWKTMHPDTRVLDMSAVPATNWFYGASDLAAGKVRGRRGWEPLGIGLRRGDETLCVSLPLLHARGIMPLEIDGVPLAVVWHAEQSAALVYDRRVADKAIDLELRNGSLIETGGRRSWNALTGASDAPRTPALRRFPYLPTYVEAWRSYYPKGRILEPDGN